VEIAQIDAYVGELLDVVDKLGVKDNTIFIFMSDNGAEMLEPWTGWAGPWRGTYFTGLEGSLRVPFIVRWTSKITAGRVSNEIVHEMDIFPTIIARVVGCKVPTDRAIESINSISSWASKTSPTATASSFMPATRFTASKIGTWDADYALIAQHWTRETSARSVER
jgi:arylsulfatase A-like enzyme